MAVQRFQVKLTAELLECLRQADLDRKGGSIGVGPLIEHLLRKSPAVKAAQAKLGVEFPDRPSVGKPKKAE